MVPTPTPTASASPSTSSSGSDSSSSSLQVISYNVHSCIGTDGVCSPQRIVDVLSAAAAAGAAGAASSTATCSTTKEERPQTTCIDEGDERGDGDRSRCQPAVPSTLPPTFAIVALQEIESNGVLRARQHDRGGRSHEHGDDYGDGLHVRPIRTRIWSAPHADDQPQMIADGLAAATAASSSGRSCHHQYHVSFAPAITSLARDRYHERHGEADDRAAEMGRFGIAILSQLPILETRIHRYKRYKKKTLRNAQACLILLPPPLLHGTKKQQSAARRAIWVVNTHLGCHSGGEQYEQAMELVVFLQSLSRTSSNTCGTAHRSTTPKVDILPLPQIILCGDFNSPPFFRSMELIRRAGFVDTWEVGGLGHSERGCTFPSDGRMPGLPSICSLMCCCKMPMLRLDYIWFRDEGGGCPKEDQEKNGEGSDAYNEGIVLKRARVIKNDVARCASDHLPIACYFDVGHR